MIFVLEGVDRVGKTTLANRLSEVLHWPLITLCRPQSDQRVAWKQGKKDFKRVIRRTGCCIVDRFSYSELVYSKVLDRECDRQWYLEHLRQYREKLKIIYLHERYDLLTPRWTIENLPIDRVIPLITEYYQLFRELGLIEFQDIYHLCPRDETGIDRLITWMKEKSA